MVICGGAETPSCRARSSRALAAAASISARSAGSSGRSTRMPLAAVRARRRRLRRRSRRGGGHARVDGGTRREVDDPRAGEIVLQDLRCSLPRPGHRHRPEHTQPHAMPRSASLEAVAVPDAVEGEERALDVLPAEGIADRDAQALSRDHVGLQTVEPQAGDAAGRVVRDRRQVAQPAAAEAGGMERPQQVARPELGRPAGQMHARRIGLRRQVGHVDRARPDLRRPFGVAAAPRAVEDRRRRAIEEQHLAGRRFGRPPRGCGRSPVHLAVRLIAEIEPLRLMAPEVGHRERPDGHRQRLERGRRAVGRRLADEHARDVVLQPHVDDVIAPAAGEADAQGEGSVGEPRLQRLPRLRFARRRCRPDRPAVRTARPPEASSTDVTARAIRARLTVSAPGTPPSPARSAAGSPSAGGRRRAREA